MKTKKAWDKSVLEFDEFVKPFDKVDSDIYHYFLGVVPTQFQEGVLFQCGECQYEERGLRYYATFTERYGNFYFLGNLPAFKEHNL